MLSTLHLIDKKSSYAYLWLFIDNGKQYFSFDLFLEHPIRKHACQLVTNKMSIMKLPAKRYPYIIYKNIEYDENNAVRLSRSQTKDSTIIQAYNTLFKTVMVPCKQMVLVEYTLGAMSVVVSVVMYTNIYRSNRILTLLSKLQPLWQLPPLLNPFKLIAKTN